jgi:hypothetical protein
MSPPRILSHVGVTINGFWIGFIALMHSTRNYKGYRPVADLHTLQFIDTHKR